MLALIGPNEVTLNKSFSDRFKFQIVSFDCVKVKVWLHKAKHIP